MPKTDNHIAELMLEHFKVLRTENAEMKDILRELKVGQISIRDDIHGVRSDIRRIERGLASVELDVEKLKIRSGLIDSEEPLN